ncbi:MAG: rod shape-determining protein MreC [Pseudomonadota bacterium]
MNGRRSAAVLVSLVILVLVTVSFNSDPRRRLSLPGKLILEAVAAGQKGVFVASRALEDFWRNYFVLVGLRQENEELKQLLARTKARVNDLREEGQTNRRLSKLLNFTQDYPGTYLGARVVGWDPGPWFKTMTIDRGSQDGVRAGMPVVSFEGVVGRVVEVSANYAKVLLVIDYNSSVDALIQRTRVRGIVAGRSEKTCSLKYIRRNEDVVRGDSIVTSGRAGIFPRGYLLGTVGRIKRSGHDIFLEIEVLPAVDFDRLEEVLVLLTEPPSH